MMTYKNIDDKKVLFCILWISFFTALVQGLRATKTAVSVGVVLYRKWRYLPSALAVAPLFSSTSRFAALCCWIGCQLAFYLRPIITINHCIAEGKEVRQPCLREASSYQNGWFFGKVPNGLWPPPLIFGKSCCAFRDKIATKVRMFSMAGLLCIIWSYFPWDACSTTVQHGITIKLVENIP